MKTTRTHKLLAAAFTTFMLFGVVSPARAQGAGGAKQATDSNITVYGGSRTSNHLTDVTSGQSVSLSGNASYAVAVDIGIDRFKQWEIFYGHQKTELSSIGFPAASNNVPLAIDYLHFGGTYFPDGLGKGGYVAGGLGVTMLQPDRAGLNSETKPSLNIGFGYLLPLGKTFGLRFEVRGYATLLNSNSSMFCSGGCAVSVKGSALYQGEGMIGLSARF
jgi:hypothetical protein